MDKLKIVLIGAGNVATHLADALHKAEHQILQIFSRNLNNAKMLAGKVNAKAINNLQNINEQADLYIFSVSDNAIQPIAGQLNFIPKAVVHTAGSISLNIFPASFKNTGVFYPFQTFSKQRSVNFSEIPLCIEANNPEFEQLLINLAHQLSDNVQLIDTEKRKYLHLSGVFACNFVNHLYHIAGNIIEHQGIDRQLLFPLIKETAAKVKHLTPKQAQTGPAVRNDTESLKKHLDLLTSTPEYKDIYQWFSKQIYQTAKDD